MTKKEAAARSFEFIWWRSDRAKLSTEAARLRSSVKLDTSPLAGQVSVSGEQTNLRQYS